MTDLSPEDLAEQVRVTVEILAELRAEEEAAKAVLEARQQRANEEVADDIDAHLPCRVQVVRSETDAAWESGGPCDLGRIGWVRVPVHTTSQAATPLLCAYVEDMGPGRAGDRNPTRYHQPRHLRRIL